MATDDSYARLVTALRARADLAAALHLLEWDQETFMPSGVLASRSRQIGALATLLHERETDPSFLALVDELAQQLPHLDPAQAVDVRETKRRLDRRRALDAGLVGERATLQAEARGLWIEARRDDDFARVAPALGRIIAIERRVAAAIDATRPPYDVLLEEYEPGASTAILEPIFETLRAGLQPLVERLRARLDAAPPRMPAEHVPLDAQRRFNRFVAERIGFDFTRGRLDEAAHPFTMEIGEDIRLTTRYDEHDPLYALYSTLHEGGHGLYEQGLDPAAWGLPRGTSCSLGIHESQSRLWENQIGRSPAFWQFLLPHARQAFPTWGDTPMESIVRAVNDARPSLIRTESDEITYNLHIILRFELERALIDDRLSVADLPAAWREKMRWYLGVEPATDREGVLQDVHWFSGAIGYFPTYTLGNIYSAQLLDAAEAALGSIDALVAAGEFATLLGWLHREIHHLGQTYRATDLITRATGHTLSPRFLLRHLAAKVDLLDSA